MKECLAADLEEIEEEYNDEYIIYVVDTETTGLTDDHEIIELAASRFYLSKPEEIEEKSWLIKALNPQIIENKALEINGHKREDILHLSSYGRENYKPPDTVALEFENWVLSDMRSAMDRCLAGQNIDFDARMMKAMWQRLKMSDTFPFAINNGDRTFDTKRFATAIDLLTGRRRRYYNLGTLVKSFGVKKRKAHRAAEDVAMTKDLTITMLNPLREVAQEAYKECYIDLDEY